MAQRRFWRNAVVKQIVFYIEGGRGTRYDIEFRQAFHTFFAEIEAIARQKGIGFRPRLAGSRRKTYELFCNELMREAATLHILLVDSEAPVAEFGKCWKHLKERSGDEWDCPPGADDSHCHLMVEAMEAWFFADPEALAGYYGQKFNANALPKRQNVEDIPKIEHISSLEAATKPTQKGRYDKFGHAPEILMRLDVSKVRERAPHCERIFTTLADLIAAL